MARYATAPSPRARSGAAGKVATNPSLATKRSVSSAPTPGSNDATGIARNVMLCLYATSLAMVTLVAAGMASSAAEANVDLRPPADTVSSGFPGEGALSWLAGAGAAPPGAGSPAAASAASAAMSAPAA